MTPRRPRARRVVALGLAASTVLSGLGSAEILRSAEAATGTRPGPGDRQASITRAAAAYGVPERLLSAYSYAQTRWDDHHGRPSTDGGYGPGHLVDASGLETGGRDGGGPGDDSGVRAKERADTLGRAARLTGLTRDRLRTDADANVRGAAALLADAQRRLGRGTGPTTDPGTWYEAVAATAVTDRAGIELADAVVHALRHGATRTTSDHRRLTLTPAPVGPEAAAQRRRLVSRLPALPAGHGRGGNRSAGLDCPEELDCEWLPAPYAQLPADPSHHGNHDVANRPAEPEITTIVVHNTEGRYNGVVTMAQDINYLAWNYTIRSSDGHVAQHVPNKDLGWHAGNWYVNTHSIGIEHEGYAAQGGTWFSEPMYRSSAALVRELAQRYSIPLDRGHVVGHDQVPGTTAATTPGMHWDPGPFWDWDHYFDLLDAPLQKRTRSLREGRPTVGDVVRVLPDFDKNRRPLTGCTRPGARCPAQGSNVVPVRTAPNDAAALVNDIGQRPSGAASTWAISDWGGKAATGTDYVVGAVNGDWVGVWFAGRLGWIRSSASAPTLRIRTVATVARPNRSVVRVYGRAYPELGAYPKGQLPQPLISLPYRLTNNQSYVVLDAHPPTDYYKAKSFDPRTPGDHVDVVGRERYLLVSVGHRLGYVRRDDVDVRTVRG